MSEDDLRRIFQVDNHNEGNEDNARYHFNQSIRCILIIVGPGLTEFRIDQMAFGQPERTCLNIQNVPLL